jgi:CRISPR/Cas system CSM-associated protein Csm5 (group 7 of RAMP superfamily)
LRPSVFIVLGVVAMGDLNHAANVDSSNNIELHLKETEGNTAEPDQKKSLRPVDNLKVSESIFSRWMRKLDTSCDVMPCESIKHYVYCKARGDCAWSKNKEQCKNKKRCEELNSKKCNKKKRCSWDAEVKECFTI